MKPRWTLPLVLLGALAACIATGGYAPVPDRSARHPVTGKPTGLPVPTEAQSMKARAGDKPPSDRPPPQPLRELPPLEAPVICTTVNGGEHWHFKGSPGRAQPRDNTGDGWIAVIENEDGDLEYWLMMRQGSPPPGGVFYRKKWDGDPTSGWVTQLHDPTKAMPSFANSPSQWNIDTHSFAQNPWSKMVTFVHFSKPGYYWPNPPQMSSNSETGFVQRAITRNGGKTSNNYKRFRNDFIIQPEPELNQYENLYNRGNTYQGGSCEMSLVIAAPYAILFWEHKTWGEADWTGQVFKGRIHRAWCWLWDLDKEAPFVRLPGEGYSFDPEEARLPDRSTNNDDALWGTANITLRAGITMNPHDNILHMVYQTSKPQVRWDGKPATGYINDRSGIAHAWSDDYGWHWHFDYGEKRNGKIPLMTEKALPGYRDNGTANRLNSPVILFDVNAVTDDFPNGQGWLFYWGNATDTMNQPGTRLYAQRFKL